MAFAAPATAIDFLDGKVQAHGFYEMQVRSLQKDFSPQNELDLAQWYHVLDLEIEANLVEDSHGPLDLVSSFMRFEFRYDCVWKRGCNLFPNVNAYGDKTGLGQGRLPERVQGGRRSGFHGSQFIGDTQPYLFQSLGDAVREPGVPGDSLGGPSIGNNTGIIPGRLSGRVATQIWNTDTFGSTYAVAYGPDGVFGTPDDIASRLYGWALGGNGKRCLFGSRKVKSGNIAGYTTRDLPWNPRCEIQPRGVIRNYPNPFRAGDFNPAVGGGGLDALPFRPAPLFGSASGNANKAVAQGIYYPNHTLANRIRHNEFSAFDQNFSVDELQWNLGASQQRGEYFLKEAYFDIEMFDSRLWLRLGKQAVVWGKTELFRNQDRINPQDLALTSLPTLEESRIALWAARAVWSFYEVGPFEDVRLEGVANIDQFEPADLGRCGEPFTALVVCDKTFGLMAHGVTGAGVAGEIRPNDPWKDIGDLEGGVRLEWRYDRFSFSLTDFYGFQDLPFNHIDQKFERNVDPFTGRPRQQNFRGRCTTGTEQACLTPANALTSHSANQQMFAWICASTVGVANVQLGANDCFVSLLNSQHNAILFPLGATLNFALAGSKTGAAIADAAIGCNALASLNGNPSGGACAGVVGFVEFVLGNFRRDALNAPTVFVPLSQEANDNKPGDSPFGVAAVLSDQQEALLGCGPFYGTKCDVTAAGPAGGVDLLNAEASFITQSWVGIGGTESNPFWDTLDNTVAQPGTVGFNGMAVCSRNLSDGASKANVILPGCRGPGDPGYNPLIDGDPTTPDGTAFGRVQPFTRQQFKSEGAILSWNFMMLLAGIQNTSSALGAPVAADLFDSAHPFRRDACSFRMPQFCAAFKGLLDQLAVQRPSRRAGGNSKYGRADFVWQSSFQSVLKYQRTNVVGFSTDFAEDRTKSNWSIEYTWEQGAPVTDNFEFSGIKQVDFHRMTISVDRPTFVNFLNQNRTFFFNSQLFVGFTDGYTKGMTDNGPFNVLWTAAVSTGYFQDRLLPSLVFVNDVMSHSGAFLPQIVYRFTENFSATFGVSAFWGTWQRKRGGINDPLDSRLIGRNAKYTYVQNGLAAVRERDEMFIKVRYTF